MVLDRHHRTLTGPAGSCDVDVQQGVDGSAFATAIFATYAYQGSSRLLYNALDRFDVILHDLIGA